MVLSSKFRFVLYVGGLYVAFIQWGYLQEKLTTTKYVLENSLKTANSDDQEVMWDYPFLLNFIMAIVGFIIAWIVELFVRTPTTGGIPVSMLTFWKSAATLALASPIGYASLKYIPFPLMVLTKSSKPVPVMIFGVLIYGQKYPWFKYISVLLICSGIILFSLFKKSGGKSSNSESFGNFSLMIGIAMVGLNLFLDGITNNEQDLIFQKFKVSSLKMMQYMNVWQMIYLGFVLIATYFAYQDSSELIKGVNILLRSSDLRFDILWFSICASIGQVLIYFVMKEFGSLTWITISVTRKLFTILISVFAFNHSINHWQWLGIAAVFAGMILEIVMNEKKPKKTATVDTKEKKQ